MTAYKYPKVKIIDHRHITMAISHQLTRHGLMMAEELSQTMGKCGGLCWL